MGTADRAGRDDWYGVRMRLPASDDALRAARRFAAQVTAEAGQERLVDDVTLLAAELTTNAVLHGTGPIALTVWTDGDLVRLEVEDGAAAMPSRLDAQADQERGRGLEIVEGLADQWGAARLEGNGKVVWAELRGDGGK